MATTTLVNSDIEIGRQIVTALTRAKIPVAVYLWAFVPQLQEWQFIIATPLVDTKGPLAAYGEVNKVLRREGLFDDTPLRRIFLRSPNDRVLKSLEKESRVLPQESFRIVNEHIAGNFVEDAYLYTGSIHVLRDQNKYLVVYAPYSWNRGENAGRALPLDSMADVKEFLETKVKVPHKTMDPALRELDERGGVSIPNVQLKPHDLRRLGLV
jgi:hypothetical protein